MSRRPKQFAAVGQVLRSHWSRFSDAKGMTVKDAIASKELDQGGGKSVGRSTFHAWLTGDLAPDGEQVERLGELFYADLAARRTFVAEVNAAREKRRQAPPDPLLEVIGDSARPLIVGPVQYEGFCDGTDKYCFDRFFKRFTAFAGMQTDVIKRDGAPREAVNCINLTDAEELLCHHGRIDIVLGIFATADRAQKMRFLPLPIRIPVNGVFLVDPDDDDADGEHLGKALMGEDTSIKIKPIVNPREVGGLHVTNFLNMNESELRAVDYEAKSFYDALVDEASRSEGNYRPVCVADEVMCLKIMMHGAKSQTNLRLVEGGSKAKGGAKELPQLPRYRLAFAISRDNEEFYSYMLDALTLYVESNVMPVVQQLKDLKRDLFFIYSNSNIGGVQSYIDHWMGLDRRNSGEIGVEPGFVRESDPFFEVHSAFAQSVCEDELKRGRKQ